MNLEKLKIILKDNDYTLGENNNNLIIYKRFSTFALPIKVCIGYAYGNPIYAKIENVTNVSDLILMLKDITIHNEKDKDELINLIYKSKGELF